MFFTYVLYSASQDIFYIGFTNNLERRLDEHKRGHTQTTSKMPDAKLVYYEACISQQDAQLREKSLKTGFGREYLRKRLKESIMQP